jgi:hypothetical protein
MKRAARARAIQLRHEGQSIKQIARTLGVSKGSVSVWVREVVLNENQLNGLMKRVMQNGANVGQARAAGYRCLDEKQRRQGYEWAERDPEFRILCGMYWGEGTKTKSLFYIVNSDPRFIRFICSWLGNVGVEPSAVQFCFQYHRANGRTEQEVVDHWLSEVPQLRQCVLRKCRCVDLIRPSQTKLIGKCPNGTCALYVHKSRRLFNLVMGGIEYLSRISRGD